MGKLLNFFDKYLLKIGISFLIIFIALYPKLPSVHIPHTWVYIRLEDFSIAAVILVWIMQFLRRRIKFPTAFSLPIFAYWVSGFLSLVFCLLVLAPHLANFFPNVAILSYFRRIEYMVLFFIAFSTIKSVKDVRDYLIIFAVTVTAFSLYGLGQRYYIHLWQAFPAFFQKFQFCFPSFQTGNEEFAKGIPLCLPSDGRITSTFGGHYDLGAYLVLVAPIFLTLIFTLKKFYYRILSLIISFLSVIMIILTSSRISFIAYLIGGMISLTLLKKKILIIPFLLVSIILLFSFSQSTARRFLQTFRLMSVVTNSQGQIVGESEAGLPADLRAKLARQNVILGNIPSQNLPEGSGFIGLPQTKKQTTNVAVVRSGLSVEEAKRLKLENGGVEIATVSGNFLVQQALVYDISFTTRFQAEWPNAIKAFSRNILLGSGFASITLATDNDFLRLLGETGLLGLISFISIFLTFLIAAKSIMPSIKTPLVKGLVIGIAGGIIGLFINAFLIDVFESSKVAETLWILMGISMGALFLFKEKEIDYIGEFKKILTSHVFIFIYFLSGFIAVFFRSISNFFVADDFTWLYWSATSTLSGLEKTFVNAQGFFYRPLDKIVVFFLYTLFAFKPEGYHLFGLILHFLIGAGVYLLCLRIFNKKYFAAIAAFVFMFLPSQAENVYWISTISITLSTLFMLYGLLFMVYFRGGKSKIYYVLACVLALLGLFSYEMAVVFPILLILTDYFVAKVKFSKKLILSYLPFVLFVPLYLLIRIHSGAVGAQGDYAYNLSHLVQNVIGNFVGYFGVFVAGEHFFPFYTFARSYFKESPILIAGFIIFSFVFLLGILALTKKKVIQILSNEYIRKGLFGFIFSFVALLPFLGLGNLSERYGYLASIGFAILITTIFFFLQNFLLKFTLNKTRINICILAMVTVLGFYYFKELNKENGEWLAASKITNRTLAYLRLYDSDVLSNSKLYFANVPIRKANAWIFPVGLDNGIWFIYRDLTIKINQVKSLDELKVIRRRDQPKSYYFYFDKDGIINQLN